MKVLFPVDEAYPLFKIGGLGDIGGSLPKALSKLGVDVRLALPKHPEIKTDLRWPLLDTFSIVYDSVELPVKVWLATLGNTSIPVYLFEETTYLSQHTDASDNHADKFAVFSLAVATWISTISEWQPQVVHFHDWHTSLIPVICKHVFNKTNYRFLGTIHNLVYQGNTNTPVIPKMGMSPDSCVIVKYDTADSYTNILLEGLLHADMINAVSPTYAKEIITPEYGAGIDELLLSRKDRIIGILNGLDLEVFDPEVDPHIHENFSRETVSTGKFANKQALLKEIDLPVSLDQPLIGFVGRVDPGQKGVQLIIEAIQTGSLIPDDIGFVFLGTGDPALEQKLHEAASGKANIRIFTKYDEALAARIYAASDLMVIPSKYEPCGLVQMIAMRYGALPIARRTGGLADTIVHDGNGFLFEAYDTHEFTDSLSYAISQWRDETKRKSLIDAAMSTDFSWDTSGVEYVETYKRIIMQ